MGRKGNKKRNQNKTKSPRSSESDDRLQELDGHCSHVKDGVKSQNLNNVIPHADLTCCEACQDFLLDDSDIKRKGMQESCLKDLQNETNAKESVNNDTKEHRTLEMCCESASKEDLNDVNKEPVDGESSCQVTDVTEQVSAICVCLRCGYIGCSRQSRRQHALKHYNSKNSHTVVVNLSNWVVWCYLCDNQVDPELNTDLKPSLGLLKKALGVKAINSDKCESQKKKKCDQSNSTIAVNETFGALKGLTNLGNTCFFNSVMQNLCQIRLLRLAMHYMLLGDFSYSVQPPDENLAPRSILITDKHGPLTLSLASFLKDMTGDSKKRVINPGNLFSEICKKAPRFKGFRQQDSQELLRYLLDSVRTEEIKTVKRGILRSFGIKDASRKEGVPADKVDSDTQQNIRSYGRFAGAPIIDSLFGGRLVSSVECLCCYKVSTIMESFLDLSLSLATNNPSLNNNNSYSKKGGQVSGQNNKTEQATTTTTKIEAKSKPNNDHVVSKHQQKKKAKEVKKEKKKARQRKSSGSKNERKLSETEDKDETVDEEGGEVKGTSVQDVCGRLDKNCGTVSEENSYSDKMATLVINEVAKMITSVGNLKDNEEVMVQQGNMCEEEGHVDKMATLGINEGERRNKRDNVVHLEDNEGAMGQRNDNLDLEKKGIKTGNDIENLCSGFSGVCLVDVKDGHGMGNKFNKQVLNGNEEEMNGTINNDCKNINSNEQVDVKDNLRNEGSTNVVCSEDYAVGINSFPSQSTDTTVTRDKYVGQYHGIGLKDGNLNNYGSMGENCTIQTGRLLNNRKCNDGGLFRGLEQVNDKDCLLDETKFERSSCKGGESTDGDITAVVATGVSSCNEDSSKTINERSCFGLRNSHRAHHGCPNDDGDTTLSSGTDGQIHGDTTLSSAVSGTDGQSDGDTTLSGTAGGTDCTSSTDGQIHGDTTLSSAVSGTDGQSDGDNTAMSTDGVDSSGCTMAEVDHSKDGEIGATGGQHDNGNTPLSGTAGVSNFPGDEELDGVNKEDEIGVHNIGQNANDGQNYDGQYATCGPNDGTIKSSTTGCANGTYYRQNSGDKTPFSSASGLECTSVTDGQNSDNETTLPSAGVSEILSWNHSLKPMESIQTNMASIESCLRRFCTPELLDGNNKFICEQCNRKDASDDDKPDKKVEEDGVDKNVDESDKNVDESDKNVEESSSSDENDDKDKDKSRLIYTTAVKQLLIYHPPPVLTLHLKRFHQVMYSLRKLPKHISFPLVLDIAPFCHKSTKVATDSEGNVLYSLCGVVEHSGSLHSGHYTAYCRLSQPSSNFPQNKFEDLSEFLEAMKDMWSKSRDGELYHKKPCKAKWYYISDSHVSEASEEKVLKAQAYLLFYERIALMEHRIGT